jgi:hypothetical protein
MKYLVHYVRIEHQVYRLEVEADSREEAEDIAEQEFTGSENYDVVHAEEFINQVDELEDKHHPLCTAHDGFGCRCQDLAKQDLKSKVKELLYEYHEAEISKLLDLSHAETMKLVREIMLNDWGYTEWEPRNVGNGYALFCHGSEWIDENGDNLLFDTEQEALEYVETRMPA